MKKLLKDVIVFFKEDLEDQCIDFAITINDNDLIDLPLDKAIEEAKKYGLIINDEVVIPAGTPIINIQQFGGATEYAFDYNGNIIKVDLAFDNEDEFIG